MEQQRIATNEQSERVECPSCLLKLSLLQAQVEKSGKTAVLHQGHAQLQRGVPLHWTFGQPALQADKNGKGAALQAQRETPVFSKRELDGWLCRNHESGGIALSG